MREFWASRSGFSLSVMQIFPSAFLFISVVSWFTSETYHLDWALYITIGMEIQIIVTSAVLYQLEKRGRI